MDTTARHLTRIALIVIAPLLLASGSADAGTNVRLVGSDILAHDASPDQQQLIGWAVARYQRAGMSLPPLAVYFHPVAGPCGDDGLGHYEDGRIDLCTGVTVNTMSRYVVLHEMAHAWTERNDPPATIDRFLQLRGLSSWNGRDVRWQQRGWEQAAEFISWGVGERIISPHLVEVTPRDVARGYRLLTGMRIPTGA
jgi:hypothetical protein